MKALYINNKIIIISYLVLIFFSVFLILYFGKIPIHLFLNKLHNPFFDIFFKWLTYLGSGAGSIVFCIAALFISVRLSITMTASFLLSGVFTQVLKHAFFSDMMRPGKYLQQFYDIHLIDGVDLWTYYSFPSGHSASAMSVFICFAFYTNNKFLKVFFLFIGLLIGYSRIYISQHYLNDVVAGSFIGFVFSILIWHFFSSEKFQKLERPLFVKGKER